MAHPGPLLADWMRHYRTHPHRNDLTDEECEALTRDLLDDPNSRCYAALHGGLGLDTWALVTLAGVVAGFAGVKISVPGATASEPAASDAEMATAKAALHAVSVVADLPE